MLGLGISLVGPAVLATRRGLILTEYVVPSEVEREQWREESQPHDEPTTVVAAE